MTVIFLLSLVLMSTLNASVVKKISPIEKTSSYWLKDGQINIQTQLQQTLNTDLAKNIILYIGDGMGPATIAAARDYKNQQMVDSVTPDIGIFFEQFPNTAIMKTHSVNAYVADSASTATALVTGVKTNSGLVAVSPDVQYENCASHNNSDFDLENIATMLHKKGKSIGIVTTARITHATPSVMYAHSASRHWEASVPIGCSRKDIAFQLIEKSENFNVLLGGGLDYFLPTNNSGLRTDNQNLLTKWKWKMQRFRSSLVTNLTDLRNLDLGKTDFLFGLFGKNHMDFDSLRTNQPSIEEMTVTAIKLLSKNKNGFFLMVEGGRIDHAHHKNQAKLAILETLAFEKAVRKGFELTNPRETLITVTADHSHVFTLGSYALRENDITQRNKAVGGQELDNKGHTSFLYSNGPGYNISRENITDKTNFPLNFVYNSGVPLNKETHGGEDVTVYSQGPWSHLFNGVHHQSFVAHVMMYASCSGLYSGRQPCSNVNYNGASILILFNIMTFLFIQFVVNT